MTGQPSGPRTRQDAIRDWMTLLFAVAVIAGVTGALMAWPRAFGVATVAMVAAAILTVAYFIAGRS